MPFRNIAVVLTGNASGLNSSLRQAAAEVDRFGQNVQGSNRKASQSQEEVTAAAARSQAGLRNLGLAAAATGAAVALGLVKAVSAFAEFDQALSGVRAVANATAGQMDQLRRAAIDAGQATVFSASDAARAEAELVKAGVSVQDVLGGALVGSLNLAAAGQLELADAATLAAQAMNIFKLPGAQVAHVADVLAAGANKSAADVGQLGDALRQGGLLAAQTGLSLEDTVGALSAFADNALVGSDAGTALKTMLQRLVPESEKAENAMDSIGFSAYDAQGNFVGLESVAAQLRTGLSGLSDEQRNLTLQTIFGSDAVRGANILMTEGAAGIRDYVSAVDDQGAAIRMAAIQMNNLRGDLEQLKGSIETALIQTGSGANDALRSLTKAATDTVNTFSGLPAPVQGGITTLATFTGGTLLAVGAIGTLAPKVRETRAALEGMGQAGAFASKSLGAIGKAGAVGVVLLGVSEAVHLLANEITKLEGQAAPKVDALTTSLVKFADSGKLTGAGLEGVGKGASQLLDDLDAISGLDAKINQNASRTSFGLIGRDFDQAADRVNALDDALAGLVSQGYANQAADIFLRIVQTGKLSSKEVETLRGKLDGYSTATKNAATASKLAAGASQGLASGVSGVTEALAEADPAMQAWIDDLAETITAFADPLDTYSQLLDDKQSAERAAAESTAASTKSSKDSWEDYAKDVSVSIDDYLDKLQEQLKAQRDWKSNMLLLSARGVSADTLVGLEALGEKGAPLVAKFVDATDKELRRADRLFARTSAAAAAAMAQALIEARPVLARVAAQAGEEVATGYARKLLAGKVTVEEIARSYGIALKDGIPESVKTTVFIAGVNAAKSDAREIYNELQRLPTRVTIPVTVGRFAGKSLPTEYAAGGQIRGVGGPRDDRNLALVSHGEFVQPTASVDYYGLGFMEAIRQRALPRSPYPPLPRYADGGPIGKAPAPSVVTVRVPVTETRTNSAPVNIEHLHGLSIAEVEAEAERRRALDSSPGWMGAGR